jgi:phosphohistidine phosphatase SixA
MLAESGAKVAYCSDAARTRETLEPLKQALGNALAIHPISAGAPGGPTGHVDAVVAAITALQPGTTAIVVSHSNTVGPIIQGLGGGTIAPIDETEFDKLFVLFKPANGQGTLLRLRY